MKENDIVKKKIMEVIKKHPEGILINDLTEKCGLRHKFHKRSRMTYSRQTISRYVLELKGEGKIIIRTIGPGKMIYLVTK